MNTYTIKRTVIEYYSVEANTPKEALATGIDVDNLYEIEVKSERAFLDRLNKEEKDAR